jgi:hypothetical protein
MYKNGTYKQFKGYGLNKIGGWWRAEAYSNPSFYSNNLADVKKQITQYLNQFNR